LKIDLRWHFGHGLYLLVIAHRVALKRGMDPETIRQMLQDMQCGSYAGLLTAFEHWLPGEVEFVGDPRRNTDGAGLIDKSAPPELGALADPNEFIAAVNKLRYFWSPALLGTPA
jgi:hypothetical protein